MTNYLLLRNNKESGPYTLEQLIQLGLKAYDLVWATGKSAAWRYPSEIPELKTYAPVVEEQPYDRFFKKPEATQEETPVAATVVEQKPVYAAKKSVFVTMPGQTKSRVAVTTPVEKQQEKVHTGYEKYLPAEKTINDTAIEQSVITIKENPETAQVKYSQPLDEIKEMYVKTLHERKQKLANREVFLKYGKKAAVIAAIIGAGVLIGMAIQSGKNEEPALPVAMASPATTPASTVPAEPTFLPGDDAPPVDNTVPGEQSAGQATELFQEEKQQRSPLDRVTKAIIPPSEKKRAAEQENAGEQYTPRSTEVNERGERTRTVRSEEDVPVASSSVPKATLKSNPLVKQVSVSSNEYKVVPFGGIRNLQLTVSNDSKYMLDNVTVEVQYLKPSEDALKTETIQFKSVEPNGSMTIKVPDTNRGIKVKYKVVHILSRASETDMADL